MRPSTVTEFEDDCCCCHYDCCDATVECCDDPTCEEVVTPVPAQSPRRRQTMSVSLSSNAALRSLIFFGMAVASATAHGSHGHSHSHGEDDHDLEEEMMERCAAEEMPAYNLGFHIGGIFILFAISALGIFGTLALGSHAKLPFYASVLQIFKMFGIGIICATAWMHLLPEAYGAFGNPCIPAGWQKFSSGYVGLFAMLAAFLVQFIEITAIDSKNKRTAAATVDAIAATQNGQDDCECTDLERVVVSGNSAAFMAGQKKVDGEKQHVETVQVIQEDGGIQRNNEFGTIVLEAGIIFHSIIIGITLGVCGDNVYSTLLIAIAFHQMFEGMALGVLISQNVFNENDGAYIVVQGIFASLSAGILFYSTYTELMSSEVSHSGHFHGFSPKFKAACFLAMYLGAAAMAILAIWA
ncbi:hypothetical protein HDU79_000101 [Rhizoclosmatium sp. JEL0117]|nr:hypothetical protein HDU79_000101 [Rhizoclosmatium sp. JEL0117]